MTAWVKLNVADRPAHAARPYRSRQPTQLAAIGDCLTQAMPLDDAAPFTDLLDRLAAAEARAARSQDKRWRDDPARLPIEQFDHIMRRIHAI
jgi:hypothetical protein